MLQARIKLLGNGVVLYEAHVKGLTKLAPELPDDLPAGIDDSKALTHARREALEALLAEMRTRADTAEAKVTEAQTKLSAEEAARLADAAALEAKPVNGQIPVQQLRRIFNNQSQFHARPRIRTTAG